MRRKISFWSDDLWRMPGQCTAAEQLRQRSGPLASRSQVLAFENIPHFDGAEL